MILAVLSRPTNRRLLCLMCLLTLPCQAAEPTANLKAHFNDSSACGDGLLSKALRQKILGTIREEVRRRTAPDSVTVDDQELQLQACPPPVLAGSDLVIKEAEYDAARDLTVFWLASSPRGNSLPPLIATVHKQRSRTVLVARHDVRSGQAVSMNDFVETAQSSGNLLLPSAQLWGAVPNASRPVPATQNAAPKTTPNAALLVKVGMPSELVLLGKKFRGSMTVIPLESGRLGDEVRVRDPGTRNIRRAKVISINQLEETF